MAKPRATGSSDQLVSTHLQVANPPWSVSPGTVARKLEGAWVVKDVGFSQTHGALEIRDNHVRFWQAKSNTEEIGTLVVEAPCVVGLEFPSSTGDATHEYRVSFAWSGEALHLGLGAAAVNQSGRIIACTSAGVFVSTEQSCTLYRPYLVPPDYLVTEGVGCSFDGKLLKVIEPNQLWSGLQFNGDVGFDDQLAANITTRAASYEDAKREARASAPLPTAF